MSIEQMASQDYDRALFKAAWRKILTRLRGESNELLPFEQVREQLPFRGQRYIGMHEVPVDKIVGSMGRYRDFDRAFLPRQKRTRGRWINIDKAHYLTVGAVPLSLTGENVCRTLASQQPSHLLLSRQYSCIIMSTEQ